jgi:uncharacterized phage protein (TIGR01671 family)
MKREIKFRAWDESLKVMITPFIDFIHFKASENCVKMSMIHQNFDEYEEFVPSEIMQFTGLKDKNGKEIYEGDIILHKWSSDWDTGGGQRNIEVRCDTDWGYYNYRCLSGLSSNIEIIGNIYENPELLK